MTCYRVGTKVYGPDVATYLTHALPENPCQRKLLNSAGKNSIYQKF